MSTETNILKDVPGFFEVIERILQDGFFSDFNVNVAGIEDRIFGASIKARGYIPFNPDHNHTGCGALIDPQQVLEKFNELVNQKQVKEINSTEVKTQPWKVWDDDGNTVIGSKGATIDLNLYISFNY